MGLRGKVDVCRCFYHLYILRHCCIKWRRIRVLFGVRASIWEVEGALVGARRGRERKIVDEEEVRGVAVASVGVKGKEVARRRKKGH